jgi:hypothetical protein
MRSIGGPSGLTGRTLATIEARRPMTGLKRASGVQGIAAVRCREGYRCA